MKTKKRVLGIAGAVLAAGVLGGCIYLNTLMPIITGYAAKNLASAVFVSGRDQADVEALDLHFSFIKFDRNKVDYEKKTVTSRFLWAKATAVYREGYGVTLLRGKDKVHFLLRRIRCPGKPAIRITCRRGTTPWSPGWNPSRRLWWTTMPTTAILSLSWSFMKEKWWRNAMGRALPRRRSC